MGVIILDKIYDDTILELNNDYDGDIDKFISNLENRLFIARDLNSKYSVKFKPFREDIFEEQIDILSNIKNSKINTEVENKENLDIINKAPHYNTGKYECIEVMREVFGDDKLKIWCILNAFKYLYRCYYKNGNQDLQKAAYYLNYINKNLIDKEKNS